MLSRLALRLAAVEALTGATIAGARVYDSRIDPIAAAATEEALDAAIAEFEDKPVLVVYTEEDEARPFEGERVPIRDRVVTLVVEALIATRGRVEVTDDTGASVVVATLDASITDRQREALLDLLEAQIARVLIPEHAAAGPAAALYRRCAREARAISSTPLRAGGAGLRRALRTVTLHIQVARDDWASVLPGATGIDRLPEPLRAVTLALPEGSSGRAIAAGLAGLVASPPAVQALQGVDLLLAFGREPTADDHDAKASFQT